MTESQLRKESVEMKWNNDWRTELKLKNGECYIRLCECRNTKEDILLMAKMNRKYNSGMTKEDCLDRIIEWVTDWNNQYEIDFTRDEYNRMLHCM